MSRNRSGPASAIALTLAALAPVAHADQASSSAEILVPSASFVLRSAARDRHRLAVVVDAHPLRTIEDRAARGARLPAAALMTATDAALGCDEGLLVPTGPKRGCDGPTLADGLLLLTADPRIGTRPRWRDLWDVARLPGRRGLPRDGVGLLEIALLADGVRPGDVYRTLGSGDGEARAFRKLDQLRPYIAWWTDGAEARRALLSGAVLMTVLPADQLAVETAPPTTDALRVGDLLSLPLVWVTPTATAPGLPGGVGNAASGSALPPAELPSAPSAAATVPAGASPTLGVDVRFWRDHQELRARFRVWLGS